MNELHLFAGAGGGILAGQMLGHRCVCAVEWDEYAQSVLVARQNDGTFPPFPIWDDVQTFDGQPWRGIVDVVAGGFPCQAYSTAASGKNTADDLWPEMRRIVADVAPRYVFAENVSRIAVDNAANDCEQMGYQTRCIAISAKDMGADHIRERYWLLAYSNYDGKFLHAFYAKTRWLPELGQSVWEDYPESLRVADGVAHRTHRLKAIGNGQVPQCAVAAWNYLCAA